MRLRDGARVRRHAQSHYACRQVATTSGSRYGESDSINRLPTDPITRFSAGGGNRTHTPIAGPRILSPVRLPVPPPRRDRRAPITQPPNYPIDPADSTTDHHGGDCPAADSTAAISAILTL